MINKEEREDFIIHSKENEEQFKEGGYSVANNDALNSLSTLYQLLMKKISLNNWKNFSITRKFEKIVNSKDFVLFSGKKNTLNQKLREIQHLNFQCVLIAQEVNEMLPQLIDETKKKGIDAKVQSIKKGLENGNGFDEKKEEQHNSEDFQCISANNLENFLVIRYLEQLMRRINEIELQNGICLQQKLRDLQNMNLRSLFETQGIKITILDWHDLKRTKLSLKH